MADFEVSISKTLSIRGKEWHFEVSISRTLLEVRNGRL